MTNPVSCRDGHTFCESCINVWLTSHKACPLDRQPLRKRELIRNLPLRGVIDNLDVRCANGVDASPKKKRKTSHQSARTVQLCPWAGKLKDLEEHSGSCPCEVRKCLRSLADLKCSASMRIRRAVVAFWHVCVCLFLFDLLNSYVIEFIVGFWCLLHFWRLSGVPDFRCSLKAFR